MNASKSVIAVWVMSMALAVSAQTPAAQPDAGSAAARDKPCRADPAKCAGAEKGNKMRQAMSEACAKTPEACKERHEHAVERRQQVKQRPAGAEK